MRKLILTLLVLLLAALPALAEDTPVFSEDVLLLQDAHAALTQRYGLSLGSIGLFAPSVTRYGDTAIVRYTPDCALAESLLGEYAVIITPEGATAHWTHDGVDPALWQSGDLNSPAWGEPQLLPYVQQTVSRYCYSLPYATETIPARTRKEFKAQGGTITLYGYSDWPDRDLYQRPVSLAREAVQTLYSLTEAQQDTLYVMTLELAEADDQRCWIVTLSSYFGQNTPTSNGTLLDPTGQFIVVIDDADGTILHLYHESGFLG